MTVFYADAAELATVSNTFSVNNIPTDPTTVSLIITDPLGVSTTYTYAAAQITRTGTGAYSKDVPCPTPGLWAYEWVGTGAASDAAAGSWFVIDPNARLYGTLDELKLTLGMTDTDRDTLVLRALRAASRGIDRFCGRRFYMDGTTSARVYAIYAARGRLLRRRTGEVLLVDDVATSTGLIVELGTTDGASYTALTDYRTEPDNNDAEGLPITALRRDFGFWGISPRAAVRVTARWGWPAVPDNVATACLLQAARLYRRKDSPQGVMADAAWGAIRVASVDPDVRALLAPYRQPGFG